jgi:hypothetical protein
MVARRWSQDVTHNGNSLTVDRGIFTNSDPAEIARTLKESAEHSRRRRTTPFRSAMSVLTFYINRAGTELDAKQRKVLEAAKDELRKAFGKL